MTSEKARYLENAGDGPFSFGSSDKTEKLSLSHSIKEDNTSEKDIKDVYLSVENTFKVLLCFNMIYGHGKW